MDTNYYTKNIDAFLTDRLDPEEKAAFEKAMEEDETLKEEVQDRKIERSLMQQMVRKEYQEKLKDWLPSSKDLTREIKQPLEEGGKEGEKPVRASARRIQLSGRLLRFSLAASFLLLLGLGTRYWLSNSYNNEALVAQFYLDPSSDLADVTRQGDPNTTDPTLNQARLAYEKQEYAEVIGLLKSINNQNETTQYLLAHSQYQQGAYQEARESFVQVENRAGRYREKAQYYQLLCALQLDQLDENFQDQLKAIAADEKHSFRPQALQMQRKVNSIWRSFISRTR
ncbi:MAG: hypothetical protein HRU41_02415 [Saprospiraceae bacterium]|nr:hypothetical protein [Saprospiraceae bacterium]